MKSTRLKIEIIFLTMLILLQCVNASNASKPAAVILAKLLSHGNTYFYIHLLVVYIFQNSFFFLFKTTDLSN